MRTYMKVIKSGLPILVLMSSCIQVPQSTWDKVNNKIDSSNGGTTSTSTSTSTSTYVATITSTSSTVTANPLGICDKNNNGDVKELNNQLYFCSASGQWQVMKTSTCHDNCDNTITINGSNNSVTIGGEAKSNTTSNVATNNGDSWEFKGKEWILGRTIGEEQLNVHITTSNPFTNTFLCPQGFLSPTQADYQEAIQNGLLDFIGNQFVIISVIKKIADDHYMIVIGDATGEFMNINPMQLSQDGTALCVK